MRAWGGFIGLWVFGVGCISDHYAALPDREQDRFQQCRPSMNASICGITGDAIYRLACMRDAAAQYAEAENEPARKQWLIAHGCSPQTVDPEGELGRAEVHRQTAAVVVRRVEADAGVTTASNPDPDAGSPLRKPLSRY